MPGKRLSASNLLQGTPERPVLADDRATFFPSSGKKCAIGFPWKWKWFSTPMLKASDGAGGNQDECPGTRRSTSAFQLLLTGGRIVTPTVSIRVNMLQNVHAPATPKNAWVLLSPNLAWRSVLIGMLLIAVYWRVLGKLVTDWWRIPDFSHGFLVPTFAVYLVWANRKVLHETRIVPNWTGIAVIALALLVLLLGVYGAELFLSRISLVILLSGLALSFGGWQLLKVLRFPLLVLILAIPIPDIIFNEITLPLQMLASKLASALLSIFGVPVLREGNVIQLSAMKLEVAEACSGIRSLVSLFTLAIFYGYFLEKSFVRRAILALASIPIAIAANAVRIFGSGLCVQYWDPDKAIGFFHEFSGWVIFLVSLGCLLIVHRGMLLLPAQGRRP